MKNFLYSATFVLLTLYGFFFLPYNNEYTAISIGFSLLFLFIILIVAINKPLIFSFTLLVWLIPFLQGYMNYGLQDSLRSTIPIMLLFVFNALELKTILDIQVVKKILLIFSLVITKYLLLISSEVYFEITANSFPLFHGETRALINEPILVTYMIFGAWLLFNYPKFNFSKLVTGYIFFNTLIILIFSLLFQIRFLVLSFMLVIFLLGNKKTKLFSILCVSIVIANSSKFSDVTLDNGKVEEAMIIYSLVGSEIWFGLGLGFVRELNGILVRFSHSAFSLFYLYGGLIGLGWYIFMFCKSIAKYFSKFDSISLIILLPILHSQFVQSGYKMFGLLSIPFYFLIMKTVFSSNAQK